jgi:hypothetical protein
MTFDHTVTTMTTGTILSIYISVAFLIPFVALLTLGLLPVMWLSNTFGMPVYSKEHISNIFVVGTITGGGGSSSGGGGGGSSRP